MSGGWELLCQDKRHKNPLLDIYGEIPVVCIFPDPGQSPTGTGVLDSVCCRAVSHLRQQHPLAAMWATKASHCCTDTGTEDEGRVCETHGPPESAQELLPHSLVSLKVSVTSHECVEKVTRPRGT